MTSILSNTSNYSNITSSSVNRTTTVPSFTNESSTYIVTETNTTTVSNVSLPVGDVYTQMMGGGSCCNGSFSISGWTNDSLATTQDGVGLQCADTSGGGAAIDNENVASNVTQFWRVDCYAVNSTSDHRELLLDTIMFNMTQIDVNTYKFDATVNVPKGASLPQNISWAFGDGTFVTTNNSEWVQHSYSGPGDQFNLSLGLTVDSSNLSGTVFNQKWSLTNDFVMSLGLFNMGSYPTTTSTTTEDNASATLSLEP